MRRYAIRVRKHGAATDGHIGDLNRAGLGFRDVKAAAVGAPIGHVGAEKAATKVDAQRRLSPAIEEPHRAQQRMGHRKPTLAIHSDAVRSSAPAQLDKIKHAGKAPIREYRDFYYAVRPGQSHVEHVPGRVERNSVGTW